VQAVSAVLGLGELELAGQDKHPVVPTVGLYFPATHDVHGLPDGHVVSVKSNPEAISLVIDVTASSVKYSSTMKTPAMSPFICLIALASLPTYVVDNDLSAMNSVWTVEALCAPFIHIVNVFVDNLPLTTALNHVFCAILCVGVCS
jgi:hypothetical protein